MWRSASGRKKSLFGSYAYGTPHEDGDVDILVIMPCRHEIDQRIKIRWEVPRRFPMDLLVRTPKDIARRLADGDLFHTEIVTKGRVLSEAGNARVGGQGRRRLRSGQRASAAAKESS
ncbi:MAG: nucleotidyltransferase domain-containing protein [Gemmataceae bacterium]